MIRLIVFVVFLFLLWVLFASGFKRRLKIVISVSAVVLCVLVLLIDGYAKRESKSLIANNDIEVCGVTAQHSYRTNFDVSICLLNNHPSATLSRLNMQVIASACEPGGCNELQRVARDIPIQLAPAQEQTLVQNLSFDKVDSDATNLRWSLELVTTKGLR